MLRLGGRGARREVCATAPVPVPKAWVEGLGDFFFPPAENGDDWGDTHGFPWRAWGTPWAIGSRVALDKNNPKKRDLGVGREQVLLEPGRRGVMKYQRPRLLQWEFGHSLAMSWEGMQLGDPAAGAESVTPPSPP